jgi:hypothetical protein
MGHQKEKAKRAQSLGFSENCNVGDVDRQDLFCLNSAALSTAWDHFLDGPGFSFFQAARVNR